MIEIKVVGMTKAIAHINRLGKFDSRGLMNALAQATLLQTDLHFETGSGPDGRWAFLSPATILRNPRRKSGHPLSDSGAMKRSVKKKVSLFSAEIGTNTHYAKYHQSGTSKMPRRMFLGWNAAEVLELERITKNFMMAATK